MCKFYAGKIAKEFLQGHLLTKIFSIYSNQATFHFKTFKNDEDKTQIDCSRDLGQPFELLIGKKFKLEVWEELIKTMREKEVARFICEKSVRYFKLDLSLLKVAHTCTQLFYFGEKVLSIR